MKRAGLCLLAVLCSPIVAAQEAAIAVSGENDVRQVLKGQKRAAREVAGGLAPTAFRDFTPIGREKRRGGIATNSIVSTAAWKTIDQFVSDFHQGALERSPDANELQHWAGRLTTAQAQGRAPLLVEGKALGTALFESQEYINRGRSDQQYVEDLYRGFLQRAPDQGGLNFWTNEVLKWGRPTVLHAFRVCFEFEHKLYMLRNDATDADQDGFAQSFEDDLANFFTPLYFVSGDEPNSFARFGNFVPQVPIQGFGPNPVSHFRVQPLGWGIDVVTGKLHSVARIDYLTLWDNDNGLDFGFFCNLNIALTGDFAGGLFLQLLDQISSHPLDNERSAALVGAPVEELYFNPNPNEYKAFDYFLSAHENTISDLSIFIEPETPVPAGNHVILFLSRSKHGTYEFPPDGVALVPLELQFATYAAIEFAFIVGAIDEFTFQVALNSAFNAFNNCIVERFSFTNPQFANPRINVGEPNTPINESGFIQAPELFGKLNTPLWQF